MSRGLVIPILIGDNENERKMIAYGKAILRDLGGFGLRYSRGQRLYIDEQHTALAIRLYTSRSRNTRQQLPTGRSCAQGCWINSKVRFSSKLNGTAGVCARVHHWRMVGLALVYRISAAREKDAEYPPAGFYRESPSGAARSRKRFTSQKQSLFISHM
jgi:hypothetical protein